MNRTTSLMIAAVVLAIALAPVAAGAAEFAGTRTTKVMGAGQRVDPYKNFHFRVVFDGRTIGGFEEAGGLVATGPDIVITGDSTAPVQKIHGINKSTDVTLKRGVIGATDLQSWLQSVKSAQARKDVKIEVVDAGHVSHIYFLHRSWITKYKGPDLNGKGNDVSIEELVLGHEGIELLPPP